MNKLLSLALIALLSLSTFAQAPKKHKLNPEQIAELLTKKMTLELELDAQQQQQILQINRQQALERQQKIEEHKTSGKKIENLSTDELVQRKSASLGRQIAHQKAMKNILTEEQFETWKKARRLKTLAIRKRRSTFKRMKMHRKIQQRKMRR